MILKQKLIIVSVLAVVVLMGGYGIFSGNEKVSYQAVEAEKGDLFQEISSTGQVKKGDEINLSFQDGGKIEKIYTEAGEAVDKGTLLAELDTVQLRIQLQEAQAALELSQAKLAKLLAGATEEEISLAQTKVDNAAVALENARQNLADVELTSAQNLKEAYEDSLNALEDAFSEISNSFNAVDSIQAEYFTSLDSESLRVKDNKSKMKTAKDRAKGFLDTARSSQSREDIDRALAEMESALSQAIDVLEVVRDACDEGAYYNTVTQTDKDSLDAEKLDIIAAQKNIINSRQNIDSTTLRGQSDINKEKTKVAGKRGALEEAEKSLAKLLASPSKEDIDLKQAEVNKAQSQVKLLQNQIQGAFLKSPVKGEVVKVEKEEGEMVASAEPLLVVLPSHPYQVESDIYEEEIVKVKVGDPVDIEIVAFPGKTLKGKVVEIDPVEKIVEEVVYYPVTIDFDSPPDYLKPGLTADIVIKTDFRKGVLTIPKEALIKREGKTFVNFLTGKETKEKEIEVGLEGNDRVEVISGLKEGEEVAIP